MSFTQCVRALVWRNYLFRRRRLLTSIIEFFLPILMIAVLIPVKDKMQDSIFMKPQTIPPVFPTNDDTIIPLSFTDYVTALQAERRCILSGGRRRGRITGISNSWAVPFVKCDARNCTAPNKDAATFCEYRILALAPNNDETNAFVDWIYSNNPVLTDQSAFPFDHDFIQIFDSSEEIDKYIESREYGLDENPRIGAAIIIESGNPSYSYSLRMNITNFNIPENQQKVGAITTPPTNRNFNTFARSATQVCIPELGSPTQGSFQDTCTGQYMYNGVITLQRLVDDWIIYDSGAEEQGTKVAENGVSFVPFPAKSYTLDGFFATVDNFVPLLVVLGLMFPVSNMIRMIVLEKELRQKELMKMMSVTDFALESSWFLSYMSFSIPSAIGIAIACHRIFDKSDLLLLIVFWIIVMIAIIMYTLAISSVFSKAARASTVGLMATFGGYFSSVRVNLDTSSFTDVVLASLHPISTMSFGIQMIGSLENEGSGLNWSTISFSDKPSGYSFATAMKALLISTAIYFFFTWYLNRVLPSSYGQPYPFYFPFTKSYWFGGSRVSTKESTENESMLEGDTSSVKIEPVSEALKEQEAEGNCVEIHNLTKQYGDKNAVNGLHLSMYRGQVTALLGHNGAGKTTTINMLTGMVRPTAGHAIVAGKDIRTQMTEIRNNVGICLQHDCLFPLLTVKEHIQFFAQIKGLYLNKTRMEAEKSIENSLKDVALLEKSDTYSKNLSGGMKRKLSVAIAFCGDSEVVFLDEPTSGMDPFSRRFTWNVIRQYRPNRCIILTTHFMDEADLLGDRIAIMAEGKLRCVGSSLFLKKEYGVGYQLSIEKTAVSEFFENDGVYESVENVLRELIKSNIPESKELSNAGTEISFQLPIASSSKFGQVFLRLDEMISLKRIITYGVSITTLEEVFLMVARGEMEAFSSDETQDLEGISLNESESDNEADFESPKVKKVFSSEIVGDKEFSRHVRALFAKRAKNFKRDKKAWCCSVMLPSILSLFGFLAMRYMQNLRNLPPLTLSIEDYNIDDSNMIHPITYNAAGEFICKPGRCIQGTQEFQISSTGENYFMCGSAALVDDEMESISCSVSGIEEIASEIKDKGVLLVEDEKSVNISTMGQTIYENVPKFAASQYGALYFNRDPSSMILSGSDSFSGRLYNDTALQKCFNSNGIYRMNSQCYNFLGMSYVVSTNFTALHAPVLYQAIADQALINEAIDDEVSITATIDPLPVTAVEKEHAESDSSFLAWFILIFSFPFITGSFATFIVTERQSKAKHLQTVAGVKPQAYWTSSFLWDIINYQFPLWIVIIMMYSFNVSAFITNDQDIASGTILTLVLFGPASAAFTYCVTFLFDSPSKCNFVVITFNFLIGLAGPLIVFIFKMVSFSPDLRSFRSIATKTTWCLRWFPCFNLGKALLFIINIPAMQFVSGRGIKTVWDSEILLNEVIFLAAESFGYFALAIFIDRSPRLQNLIVTIRDKFRSIPPQPATSTLLDEDVAAEYERVISGEADLDHIVVKQMSKIYGNGKVAVDDLSFGIPTGQCFGLLGINGAGKTTTMAMLTAEFPPYSGDAMLGGHSVTKSPDETRRRIGYCPQFDAHFMNMTGREHVELYASIKGIPKSNVKRAAAAKLEEVGLSEGDSDKLSSKYSGGMKRKLSVACATIGQPPIVFLDEPSTGMDPVARRELWNVISRMVSSVDSYGKPRTSVILTTHSMEECEALCPRIGIMAGGKLRCLGSAQHLKTRFGKGYQVELKVLDVRNTDKDYISTVQKLLVNCGGFETDLEDFALHIAEEKRIRLEETKAAVQALTNDDSISSLIDISEPSGYVIYKSATSPGGVSICELAIFCIEELRVKTVLDFMQENYSNVVFRERQENKVRFEIASEGVKISSIFELMEKSKVQLQLSHYGISQTTLEQVFNMHAAEAAAEIEGVL